MELLPPTQALLLRADGSDLAGMVRKARSNAECCPALTLHAAPACAEAAAAMASNCSALFLTDGETPSGCCAQTAPDVFSWWQYAFPSLMQASLLEGCSCTTQQYSWPAQNQACARQSHRVPAQDGQAMSAPGFLLQVKGVRLSPPADAACCTGKSAAQGGGRQISVAWRLAYHGWGGASSQGASGA